MKPFIQGLKIGMMGPTENHVMDQHIFFWEGHLISWSIPQKHEKNHRMICFRNSHRFFPPNELCWILFSKEMGIKSCEARGEDSLFYFLNPKKYVLWMFVYFYIIQKLPFFGLKTTYLFLIFPFPVFFIHRNMGWFRPHPIIPWRLAGHSPLWGQPSGGRLLYHRGGACDLSKFGASPSLV